MTRSLRILSEVALGEKVARYLLHLDVVRHDQIPAPARALDQQRLRQPFEMRIVPPELSSFRVHRLSFRVHRSSLRNAVFSGAVRALGRSLRYFSINLTIKTMPSCRALSAHNMGVVPSPPFIASSHRSSLIIHR
jgi:hypothetical protein